MKAKNFNVQDWAKALIKQASSQVQDSQFTKIEDCLEYLIGVGLEEDEIPPIAESSLRIAIQDLMESSTAMAELQDAPSDEDGQDNGDPCSGLTLHDYTVWVSSEDGLFAELLILEAPNSKTARKLAAKEAKRLGWASDLIFNAQQSDD